MTTRIEFLYDVGSPASYLAFHRLPGIAARSGAEIVHRPVLLGGIFKAIGSHSPADIPAKAAWMWQDLAAAAERYGTPFEVNPHFPVNTLGLMRGAVAAEQAGEIVPYSTAIFDAIWRDGHDLGNPAVIGDVLTANGFDAGRYMVAVQEDAIKARLRAYTDEAVTRGVFGVPTMFVGTAMFFGQDRLDLVEQALSD